MEQPQTLLSQRGVQNQAILPMRTAMQLSLQGIKTRFGRSVVTLIGVGLGIAFLMSVLSGFHIKHGLREEAAVHRGVDRRISVLRSEIGMLDRRTLALAGHALGDEDQRFVQALIRQGARLGTTGAFGHPDILPVREAEAVDAVLLLGQYAAAGPDALEAALAGPLREVPIYVFDAPDARVAETLEGRGIALRPLAIRLRPDEVERAERVEEQHRMRMYWVVVVSLLITIGGITNAMLMSVTERFQEIATMKCLGALSGFVVKLFLIESSLIGFGGSVLGVLAGLLLPLLAYSYTFGLRLVVVSVSWPTLMAYIGTCVVTGMVLAVISGIYPARVAARMIPADALRSQV